ncbi:MAG: hypothetical protein QOG60_1679 [Frankiaceae bacterium]|nr:hypothetical protein [Frankiaceae bacterium]
MNTDFRVIVLGCGGIGSAAAYWLGRRAGTSVLALEQFALGHDRGASQDHSRIIRLAQHQDAYADLAPAAYATWAEVEKASGVQLVTKTGGLVIEATAERDAARTGTRNIRGYCDTFDRRGVDYELLDAASLSARWPQFVLRGDEQAIYQKDSGIVDARRANATHLALARGSGVQVLDQSPVRAIRPRGDGVEVVTDAETFRAERLVVAADAWTNEVLADLDVQLPLTVTQEQVTYYSTPNLADFAPDRFPVFMWHGAHNFYGFPVYGEVATKLGQHMGGHEVTATSRDFVPDPVRQQRQREFLADHVPGFLGPELYTKTCLYTIPPDQDFVLDTVPGFPQVTVAIGAGHAFKFASLLGRILSELALDGRSTSPIDTFRIDRPALTDPSFPRSFHV